MDFNKAFTYIFEDQDWVKKALIFIVMLFLGITVFLALGYFVKAIKRVAEGQEGLPEWEDWGDIFATGLKLSVIILIYSIPAVILIGIFGIGLVSAVLSGSQSATAAAGGGALFGLLLASVYGLCVSVIMPAIAIQFIKDGYTIGAGFKFGEIIKIVTDDLGNYAIALGIWLGLTFASSIVGSATWGLGTVVVSAYAYLVGAHLFGQLMGGKIAPVSVDGASA